MAQLFDNYGLDFMLEDDDTITGMAHYVVKEGKGLRGYYGFPYFFKTFGHVELWVRTEKTGEKEFAFDGVDVHSGGCIAWDLIHTGIDITPKELSKTEKIMMFKRKTDHGGFYPVHIINADVLPSFLEGDNVRVQIVAQPVKVEYHASFKEYEDAQPRGDNGKAWIPAEGALVATPFLFNHSPERYEQGKDYADDSLVHFNAKVTELYCGTFELGGQKDNLYIRCFAETEYGELEFVHTYDQVPEELRKNIKVGSIISGYCILSGDAAIGEYTDGAVKDFDHDLRLIRYSFEKGEAERLRSVLSPDATYESEPTGAFLTGPDEIIQNIDYVTANVKKKYRTVFATIKEADGPEYPAGTRCIVLAREGEDRFESIAFIEVNDDGLITRIKISNDGRYVFETDKPEKVATPLDDYVLPGSVAEAMILRAKYFGLIPQNTDTELIIQNIPEYYHMYENNVTQMLDAVNRNPEGNGKNMRENIMGYLFAKAMEQHLNENRAFQSNEMRLTSSYCPADAIRGEIKPACAETDRAKLKQAMELGKQFYIDYCVQTGNKDENGDEYLMAAVLAQHLGKMAAEDYFK